MVSCFKRENNEGDGQITWGGRGRGIHSRIPDPRTEKRQANQLTTTCGDKKGVVPRFETVKSTIVSG